MHARRRHEQRFAAIGMLAGGIAHDFNNVLSVILGYGERALSDAAGGSRLRHDLESILAAGKRGRFLVEQVLAAGRGEPVERTGVDVETVMREALDLVAARLPAGITIEAALESGATAVVGRATDVHQLFMNLATNAIQAMPKGGPLRVSAKTEWVAETRRATVGSLSAGEHVVLQVADSGVGIAPKTVRRIFDQFFTTKESNGGTGLGLSIVHEIVTDADGAIDIASYVIERLMLPVMPVSRLLDAAVV